MIFGYIGLPRSGKTTLLARYLNNKGMLYDHIYISGEHLHPDYEYDPHFITYIHPYEVGTFSPIRNSLFILCEAGTYFNNRLVNKIPTYCTDFFALHGHYGCDIVWDSQTADVDKKLRDRTERLYIVTKSFIRCFSHVMRICHRIDVNSESHDLVEGYYVPDTFLQRLIALCSGRVFWVFRPKYYNIFDTHFDVCFGGAPCLPRSVVNLNCPPRFLKLLCEYDYIAKKFEGELNEKTKKGS